MALKWLPPPRETLSAPCPSNLAFQSADATLAELSWCHFPSQIYVFGVFAYSFHAPFRPGGQNTETPY